MWDQVHCSNFLFLVNSSHFLLGWPFPPGRWFLRGSRGQGLTWAGRADPLAPNSPVLDMGEACRLCKAGV